MIQVSICRTDPKQIAAKGKVAFSKMTFTDSNLEQIIDYCRELAAAHEIICPSFEIVKIPPAE